ncbi:MAG: nucleotidyltransferase domain-containing protein [Candidatus Hodarchaeales archaeon]
MEFKVVLNLKKVLNDFIKPWYIAGGWAIDLYLGKVTRMHKDIEIVIFRQDQRELYEYLNDWILYKVIPGQYKRERWLRNEWLSLPIHEIHATSHSKEKSKINFEILLNESDHRYWYFRRNQQVKRHLYKIGKIGYQGIPYLSPEIVLLYKAKEPTIYDFKDFIQTMDLLTIEERTWLSKAIGYCYLSHPWYSFSRSTIPIQ